MSAQFVMGTVDDRGQLSLGEPLAVPKHSRVRVIMLFTEEEIDEDDEPKDFVLGNLRKSLQEAKVGKSQANHKNGVVIAAMSN